jgi:quinol monooxygenase YgiN
METTDIRKFQSQTTDAVRVLCLFQGKAGEGQGAGKSAADAHGPMRSEPGKIAYVLHSSTKDPHELVFDEIFESYRAFEEHGQKPYIKSLRSKVEHLLAAPVEVKTYTEVR